MRIRICFFPKIRENSADTVRPIAGPGAGGAGTDAGYGLEPAGRGGMGRNSRRRRHRCHRLRASGPARRHAAPPLLPAPSSALRLGRLAGYGAGFGSECMTFLYASVRLSFLRSLHLKDSQYDDRASEQPLFPSLLSLPYSTIIPSYD